MITCLCVTRGNRLAMLADAVADFCAQSFEDKQLLILHDADASVQQALQRLAAAHSPHAIRAQQVAPGLTLGALRNLAVDLAEGDWVCQWDDDDRYHPLRLQLQWDAAQARGAAVNYLVDQLHWFRRDGLLFWDDWNAEPYPLNVIQGTLLARRDVLPRYPELARGEDTLHTHALMRASATQGFGVSRLADAGWCYVYSYHGDNAWDAGHHQAIATHKHLPPARLLPKWAALQQRLAQYQPPLPALRMPLGEHMLPVTMPT